jgi:hypothetical protein
VTAPKKKKWSATAKVGAKGDSSHLAVPLLEDEPQAATPPPVTPVPSTTPQKDVVTPAPTGSDGSSQRTVGIVVAGVGVVGIAVGSVFGVMALSKNDDAKRLCPQSTCTSADGYKANDDAKSVATIATVAMIVGGAALVGGAVIYFTAPRASAEKSADTRVRVAPMVAANGGGLLLGGAW